MSYELEVPIVLVTKLTLTKYTHQDEPTDGSHFISVGNSDEKHFFFFYLSQKVARDVPSPLSLRLFNYLFQNMMFPIKIIRAIKFSAIKIESVYFLYRRIISYS